MRKTEFIEKIKEMATEFGEVNVQTINKPDGNYTGLLVKVPAGIPAPVVNLDMLYNQHLLDGVSVEDCLTKVKEILSMSPNAPLNTKDLLNWDKAKTKLFLRPFGHISDGIYRKIEDIYLVPYLQLTPDGSTLTRVIPRLLEEWGINEEEVFRAAEENQETLRPIKITNIADVLGFEDNIPVFVVTTDNEAFGASAIFYEGIEDRIVEEVGEDFYILPSSVHEVLVVPKSLSADIEQLAELVMSVNGMAVDEHDRLTNSVYAFEEGSFIKVG